MANKLVLDSSVFVKSFLEEEYSQEIRELLLKWNKQQVSIIVPELFVLEVISVALINNLDTKYLLDLIDSMKKNNLKILGLSSRHLTQAIKISEYGNNKSGYPSIYDSLFHAIAIIENATFLTADKKHYAKSKQFGQIMLLSELL